MEHNIGDVKIGTDLTVWRTFCSLIGLQMALHNSGMWLIWLTLILEKYPTISYFWEGVQEAFKGQGKAYHNMHFADDGVFSDLHYISLGRIAPHICTKRSSMWKNLNAEYKTVLSCFTLSGTHLSNFFEFCNGWHDIYYLRNHLESSFFCSCRSTRRSLYGKNWSGSFTTSSSTKHKHEEGSELVDAIHEKHSSHMEIGLSKRKLDLMQQQETRIVKEEPPKEKEEACKEKRRTAQGQRAPPQWMGMLAEYFYNTRRACEYLHLHRNFKATRAREKAHSSQPTSTLIELKLLVLRLVISK